MTVDSMRLIASAGLLGSLAVIAYGTSEIWTRHRVVSQPPATSIVAPEPEGVWASAHFIPRGQQIQPADLVLMPIHDHLPPDAVTHLDAAVGRVAIADIPPFTLLVGDRISSDPARAGLAQTVPLGYRAVAIRTTDEIAVGNFIRPGDHVDIELVLHENVLPKQDEAQQARDGNPSLARTLLQDVQVLTVGDTLSAIPAPPAAANARAPEPPHTVTLALTPDQASILALGRGLGTIYLTLRNPTDLQTVEATTAHLPQITGMTPPPATKVDQGRRPIELITGNKSAVIYSTNPGDKR
jgi:pilus assembly protein CpaB